MIHIHIINLSFPKCVVFCVCVCVCVCVLGGGGYCSSGINDFQDNVYCCRESILLI